MCVLSLLGWRSLAGRCRRTRPTARGKGLGSIGGRNASKRSPSSRSSSSLVAERCQRRGSSLSTENIAAFPHLWSMLWLLQKRRAPGPGRSPLRGPSLHPALRVLLVASGLSFASTAPAAAQTASSFCADSETEGGFLEAVRLGFDRTDADFERFVVDPLTAAIFFDVAFWDNGEDALAERAAAAGMSPERAQTFANLRAVALERAKHLPDWREREAVANYSLDPRRPACLALGLNDATCRKILGGDVERLVHEGCAAGLSEPDIRQLVSLDADPDVAYCAAEGIAKAQCRDLKRGLHIPLVVLWLSLGALFFTLRFRFINLRAFTHAIAVTRGDYDHEGDEGEVSHFQALSSALSGTVGLGNIAGVAVAVTAGGPGAVFWMIVAGFLGMTSKFAECSLAQMYRAVDDSGKVLGGPMRYLREGLRDRGPVRRVAGSILAVVFAVMCIGGSLGGGNMFQANQSAAQVAALLPFFSGDLGRLLYGLALALVIGIVIIGGIRRIGRIASIVVPAMCVVYLLAGLLILILNASRIPDALGEIVSGAMSPEAGFGGFLGVLVQGFRRSGFSNEAGVGSAAIAHAAAATDEPIREGLVALLEPFIDTLIVCTMTALVVVITGAHEQVDGLGQPLEGIRVTSWAFDHEIQGFGYVLGIAAVAFAFSTMISWSYYGERAWTFLFGRSRPWISLSYRIVFLFAVVLGSTLDLGSIVDLGDLLVLGMSFPNVLGIVLLSNTLAVALNDYMTRLRSGQMPSRRHL